MCTFTNNFQVILIRFSCLKSTFLKNIPVVCLKFKIVAKLKSFLHIYIFYRPNKMKNFSGVPGHFFNFIMKWRSIPQLRNTVVKYSTRFLHLEN